MVGVAGLADRARWKYRVMRDSGDIPVLLGAGWVRITGFWSNEIRDWGRE
jgi:hypothetical protein